MSATHSNSAANLVLVIQNPKGLSVKPPARARTRAHFCAGLGHLGQNRPSTIEVFPFSFSIQLYKYVENYRKMVKMPNQFF
jgi:hypothetical protein